ncbi:hypothetical protein BD560DRAFT_350940 [Blakeslea trispora]|nr:hypothetical protein BD560DRAFT_350940 [Blakeslea trispora]
MIFNKLIITTAVALFYTTHVSAQAAAAGETFAIPNSKISWKNQYPSGTTKPTPKPEWVALVKDDPALNIKANILTPDGIIQNADPTGNNTYCNWTWDGCVKPTDIVHCVDPKVWGTSFDDGPYEITRELLKYLKSIDRKVTFFVVGKQVIMWPEVLKEAYDQGHEIGIHTWSHSELTTISTEQIIGELKWTELAIKEVLGVTPRLMRPPRGDIDDRVRYIVKQLGYTPAMWSVDSQDWRITAGGQTEAGLLANVTEWVSKLPTMKTGGNSLMHDLNNVTVGAALKALPILHPKVEISKVSTCAGWAAGDAYVETHGKSETDAKSTESRSGSSSSVTPASKNAAAQSGAQGLGVPALQATALASLVVILASLA